MRPPGGTQLACCECTGRPKRAERPRLTMVRLNGNKPLCMRARVTDVCARALPSGCNAASECRSAASKWSVVSLGANCERKFYGEKTPRASLLNTHTHACARRQHR